MYSESLNKAISESKKVCLPCPFLKSGGGSTGGNTWYGVSGLTGSGTELTRIGNLGNHRALPVQNLMQGCLLADDGSVNYYLHPNDWTKKADGTASNLDGTDGQVMIEIPAHYYRDWIEDGVQCTAIAPRHESGFNLVNKMYVSAYEAAVDNNESKLCSLINTDTRYRGGTNKSAWDALPYTQLGMPQANLPIEDFNLLGNDIRTFAANRGANWYGHTWKAKTVLTRLFMIEYATKQSQGAVNSELTSQRYKQGGLGNGVTNVPHSTLSAWNNREVFIPCGVSNALANGSGEVTYTIPFDTPWDVEVCRYRGVENIFGHLWELLEGIIVYVDDIGGSLDIYIVDDASQFTSTDKTKGRFAGNMPYEDEGVISALSLNDMIITDVETDLTYTTYFCDMLAASGKHPSSNYNQYRYGGYATAPPGAGGVKNGLFGAKADDYTGLKYLYLGTRLNYISNY